ncbi:YlbF family regulator [Wukongibacter baidiensis]|uniref:YlbF family regulator n=1 Tax=Wukongibacter baidiensis TaxID=1723361 RepID=UPI003D7FF8AD
MSLEKEIRNLVNAIQNTDEFKELKTAKADIEKYRGLKDEVDLFQKKQMELYNLNMQGKETGHLAMEVNKTFRKLSQVPEVNKLLNSGKEFNDMIFNLFQTIHSLIDSELEK